MEQFEEFISPRQFWAIQQFLAVSLMNNIPLLQAEDDDIKESLSTEEIRIALSGLRKRFKEYTPHEIVEALSSYLAQKDYQSQSVPIGRGSMNRYPIQYNRLPEPSFMHHRKYPVIPLERQQKVEELRLIARLFIQTGINYSLAQYFFPEMTKQQYQRDLQTIAVQSLNNIPKFLIYEQHVQVDNLTPDEKISIREKMVNVRDWMGKTHPKQLKTYFLFIERYYLNENVEIDFKMAIDLHRVILETARGPYMLRQQTQNVNNRGLAQLFPVNQQQKKGMTKEQQNSLILLFKQHCSIERVADLMCQKYGYHIRWSVHSVKNILMRVYKISLKRLASANQRILGDKTQLFFGYGDEDVKLLMTYENSLAIKLLLLDFYLVVKITKLKLMEYVRKVNEFFIKQHRGDAGFEEIVQQQEVAIPTLIIQDRPIPIIVIKDEDETHDKSKKQSHSKTKRISKPPKDKKGRPMYKEVIDVQSDSDDDERYIYTFGHDKAFFEKQAAQDDTDIEEEGTKNKVILGANQFQLNQKMRNKKDKDYYRWQVVPNHRATLRQFCLHLMASSSRSLLTLNNVLFSAPTLSNSNINRLFSLSKVKNLSLQIQIYFELSISSCLSSAISLSKSSLSLVA